MAGEPAGEDRAEAPTPGLARLHAIVLGGLIVDLLLLALLTWWTR